VRPLSNPDHSLSVNWTTSPNSGGSPGQAEEGIPENPNDDEDSDGLSNLAEYFFGTNPRISDANPVSMKSHSEGLTLTFDRDPQASGVSWSLESSDDLKTWTTLDPDLPEPTPGSNGLVNEAIEMTPSEGLTFYRIRIVPAP
jgi:hypothetical protein